MFEGGFLGQQFAFRFFPQLWSDPGFYLRWLGMIESVTGFGALALAVIGVGGPGGSHFEDYCTREKNGGNLRVRAASACTPGSYDDGGAGQAADRDDPIAAAGAACP